MEIEKYKINKSENCFSEKTNKSEELLTRLISEKVQMTKFETREVTSLQILNILKE